MGADHNRLDALRRMAKDRAATPAEKATARRDRGASPSEPAQGPRSGPARATSGEVAASVGRLA